MLQCNGCKYLSRPVTSTVYDTSQGELDPPLYRGGVGTLHLKVVFLPDGTGPMWKQCETHHEQERRGVYLSQAWMPVSDTHARVL